MQYTKRFLFMLALLVCFLCRPSLVKAQSMEQALKEIHKLNIAHLSKSEFETTEQFSARSQKADSSTRIRIRTLMSKRYPASIAFQLGDYDADNGEFFIKSGLPNIRLKASIDEAKKIKDRSKKYSLQGTFWIERNERYYLIGKASAQIGNSMFSTTLGTEQIKVGDSFEFPISKEAGREFEALQFSDDGTKICLTTYSNTLSTDKYQVAFVYDIISRTEVAKYKQLPKDFVVGPKPLEVMIKDDRNSYSHKMLEITEPMSKAVLRTIDYSNPYDNPRIAAVSPDLKHLAFATYTTLTVYEIEDMR